MKDEKPFDFGAPVFEPTRIPVKNPPRPDEPTDADEPIHQEGL